MKVLIIGAGLIGVTTAYYLQRGGNEVTVIDRQAGPEKERALPMGRCLHPSMSNPWNAPGIWRLLLTSLVNPNAPMQLRFRSLPSLTGWGIRFLRNSSTAAFERNAMNNLRLALYSMETMHSLRQQANIDYGRLARGSLRIFRSTTAWDEASVAAIRLRAKGLDNRRLSRRETIELEPRSRANRRSTRGRDSL